MESGVKFLEMLEEDLRGVAEREVRSRNQPPTRRSVRWKGWVGAVAALLVVAFTIGALSQLGGGATSASSAGRASHGDFRPYEVATPAPCS
jgi:hypothetical protein